MGDDTNILRIDDILWGQSFEGARLTRSARKDIADAVLKDQPHLDALDSDGNVVAHLTRDPDGAWSGPVSGSHHIAAFRLEDGTEIPINA